MHNGILLSPDQHEAITAAREILIARTQGRLTPLLLESAHGPQEKADARMDARMLAVRIIDDVLGVLTPSGAERLTREGKPSLAALIAAVK